LIINGYTFDSHEETHIFSIMKIIFKENNKKSINLCLRFIEEDVKATSLNEKNSGVVQKLLFYWQLIDGLHQNDNNNIGFYTKVNIVSK